MPSTLVKEALDRGEEEPYRHVLRPKIFLDSRWTLRYSKTLS